MLGRGRIPRTNTRGDDRTGLPIFDRIAPPTPIDGIAGWVEAWTRPGDIVLDPWGRGGWVARAALAGQRAAADVESSSLTRLLAEVVVRPPDPGHLTAAVAAIALRPHGGLSLKAAIESLFAGTCPDCKRPVVLEAMVWDVVDGGAGAAGGERPIRREYRCLACHRRGGSGAASGGGSGASGGELHRREPSDVDVERASYAAFPEESRAALRKRFPTPHPDDALPDEILDLHTPRQLEGLHGILEGIEMDNRAGPLTAALRLAFLQTVDVAGRHALARGRSQAIHVSKGRLRPHSAAGWRERNPWIAFEESVAAMRSFVERIQGDGRRGAPGRQLIDLVELNEGHSNLLIAEATEGTLRRLGEAGERLAAGGKPSRVELILGQAPRTLDRDELAQAYHDTGWALGGGAASMLPFERLFAATSSRPDGAESLTRDLAASLAVTSGVLAESGHAVVMLDRDDPRVVVAAALGGAAAGYRLIEARLRRLETESPATLVFVPPTGTIAPGPRTRANRPLRPLEGGAGDPGTIPGSGVFGAPERLLEGRFRAQEAAAVIRESAVESLRERGEPACFEQLMGDILVGLDRAGQLARLGARFRPPAADAGWRAWLEPDASGPAGVSTGGAGSGSGSSAAGSTAVEGSAASAADELLSLIRGELERGASRVIRQMEPGLFWLADDQRADAAPPLSDRVEWAVFSLLSSSSAMTQAAVFDRVAGLFGQRDAPDGELLAACVASYSAPGSTPDAIATADRLERRSADHDAVISVVAELGHRLGARVWIGRRQRQRRVSGRPLTDWLSADELDADPGSIAWGPSDELERVDCAWYARHRAAYLFEVEWTAMLGDSVLTRHARFPLDDRVVRFLVIPAERAGLVRYKLAHSPVLRAEFAARNWHVLRWDRLAAFAARDEVSLAELQPYVGLDDAPAEATDEAVGEAAAAEEATAAEPATEPGAGAPDGAPAAETLT